MQKSGQTCRACLCVKVCLERFTISVDQAFPSLSIEKKIVLKHMEKFDCNDDDFAQNLVTWADIIRKTFADDGVDEVVSTRRLCHIVQTFSIFNNKQKAIDLCIARFDDDTREAFLDLYSKVDADAETVSAFNEETNEENTI